MYMYSGTSTIQNSLVIADTPGVCIIEGSNKWHSDNQGIQIIKVPLYTHVMYQWLTCMTQYWYSVLPNIFLVKRPATNPAIPWGNHQSFLTRKKERKKEREEERKKEGEQKEGEREGETKGEREGESEEERERVRDGGRERERKEGREREMNKLHRLCLPLRQSLSWRQYRVKCSKTRTTGMEFIDVITSSIKQITKFLNAFDMSARTWLAMLNEQLTTLERQVDYIEARVPKQGAAT